jgi:hypothetical protein
VGICLLLKGSEVTQLLEEVPGELHGPDPHKFMSTVSFGHRAQVQSLVTDTFSDKMYMICQHCLLSIFSGCY